MSKKIFVCFYFTLNAFIIKAQVTLTPQVPPAGTLLKSQLWNIVVTSTSEYSSANISLTLSDVATGDAVLTALIPGIKLSPGSNQLNTENLPAINYEYLTPEFTDHNPDGFLLTGNYSACYTLNPTIHGGEVTECMPVIVEPVSPPMLNTPFNEEVVQTHTPQFTWIPPMPSEIYSSVNYNFKLVEVDKEQNVIDAIEQNIPVYNGNQPDPYLNYPGSANMLDTGKLYAWQIVANNKDAYTAKSEVWTFKIASLPTLPIIILPNGSLKLKKYLDASVGSAIGILNAYYVNEAADTLASYEIIDISADKKSKSSSRKVKSGNIALTAGQNAISIPFAASDDLKNGKTYLFQLINSRNEKWSAKFIYFKYNQ